MLALSGASIDAHLSEMLEEIGELIRATGALDGLLNSCVHSALSDGEYRSTLGRPERPSLAQVVHLIEEN